MKKHSLLLVVAIVLGFASLAFAHEEMKGHHDIDDEMMEHRQGMRMGKAAIVATENGGVIVMWGNKLYKYDKNLNLIQDVEIGQSSLGTVKTRKQCLGQGKAMGKCAWGMIKAEENKAVVPAPKQNFGPRK